MYYRLLLAVPDGRRSFLVVVVLRVAGVFAVDLCVDDFFVVVDFTGVLLLAFVDAGLVTVLAEGAGAAIASMRVAGFLGIVARTSRTASVCCSSVMRNSWWPSRLATKYR